MAPKGGKDGGKALDKGKGKEKTDKGYDKGKGASKGGKGGGGGGGDKGGKGKGGAEKGKGERDASLGSKDYSIMLQNLFKNTAVRANDIDPKALQLLDALTEAGKAEAAFAHLIKSLDGVGREKVVNWRRYVFALLRGFDAEVYNQMKEARGRPRPRRKEDKLNSTLFTTALKATAHEFVPGTLWRGCYHQAPDSTDPSPEGTVFQVECKTELGETVGLIGSTKELGSWSESSPIMLTTTPEAFPLWKSEPIKLSGLAEYKFVVVNKDKKVSRWEPVTGNRIIPAGGSGQQPPAKFGALS